MACCPPKCADAERVFADFIKKLTPYLYGGSLTIRVDHAALQWLRSLKISEDQIARWLDKLEQRHRTIVHRFGLTHGKADSLSWRPCPPECQHCIYEKIEKDVSKVCIRTTMKQSANVPKVMRQLHREDLDLRPIMEWMSQT